MRASPERTVGFVGLGAMGAHMVARLLDAGHDLAVFDTRTEAMEPHVARGALACESAQLRAAGVACLDASVSGGVAGAQAGSLTIMAAGDEALFERLRPLLEVLGDIAGGVRIHDQTREAT